MAKLDLEPGEYTAEVKEYNYGKLDNERQTPYIDICAEFPIGQEAWQKFFLSDAAKKYTKERIAYLSADGTVGGMVGNEVKLVVKRDERNPEYMVWDVPYQSKAKPMESSEREAFENDLNTLLSADGVADDADIPF